MSTQATGLNTPVRGQQEIRPLLLDRSQLALQLLARLPAKLLYLVRWERYGSLFTGLKSDICPEILPHNYLVLCKKIVEY